MRVLIVFDEIDSALQIFAMEADNELLERLNRYDGHYINDGDLSEELEDEMVAFFYDENHKFRFEDGERPSGHFDTIIVCGFLP